MELALEPGGAKVYGASNLIGSLCPPPPCSAAYGSTRAKKRPAVTTSAYATSTTIFLVCLGANKTAVKH